LSTERQLTLQGCSTDVALARAFAATSLQEWGLEHLVADTQLLVSETVTNAIRHGRPPIELTLHASRRGLRVEVLDTSSATLQLSLRVAALDEHGRGLMLVDLLASGWGTERGPTDGKVVWFEMAGER
jgi:anti-sigma regulatory factor (Ser/Thr protein kinase)